MTHDYGEVFCQAVDTILSKRLENVSYDQTILCTIVDNSRRKEGVYIVSHNGNTRFEAFSSETSFLNGNNVYVQIPGGDWNQQKLIIAKKNNADNEPFIYNKPFDSLVDISGNLISSNIKSNETGLVANSDELDRILLWSYNASDEEALRNEFGEALSNYTRLGLKASFQSWLNPFYLDGNDGIARYVTKGDYGLHLRILAEDETTSKDDADEKPAEQMWYDLYLNQVDMNGNPYDFQSFYMQEKVVDISHIDKIVGMRLYFYQAPGSFVDKDGIAIPATDFLGNQIKPNLYVGDTYISLGYDINEFNDEMIQIYTLDSKTYSRTANPLTNNHKKLQMRWIHKQDDGTYKNMSEAEVKAQELDFEVRWYRFELGHSSADEYSGVYWKRLSTQNVIQGESAYSIQDKEWNIYNKTCTAGYKREPLYFTSWALPDTTLQEEQYKAIIIYKGQPYRSNILVCTNEDEVVSKPTVDAVQALTVNCADDTFGNYRIYGQNCQLLDMAQSRIEREWVPYFKSSSGGADVAPSVLDEAESIEWIIPVDKTMIVIDDAYLGSDYEYEYAESDLEHKYPLRVHIKRYGAGEKGNVLTGRNIQKYRIRSYYSQTYSNNTIQCKVVKEKITYTATKELTFGTAGTSGTDCTLVLDFDDNVTALTLGSSSKVSVTARLYDYENEEIDISNQIIEWSFKVSDGKINLVATDAKQTIELQLADSDPITSNYNVLQATLKGWGNFDLIAYLPIPIRTSTDISFISGTIQVVYNSDGELMDYFKNPYVAYGKNGERVASTWEAPINANSTEKAYTPTLTINNKVNPAEYYLTPLSFYVKNACEKVCIVGTAGSVKWYQPILIMQNRYPSAMINKWDGSLDVGTTDKGTILAPRLAAGMKNTDNTFSGVMLGDWTPTNSSSELTKGTGLFGYHHGEQSYAFRDDGTAFIGKSGKGRLRFDGNESTITSNAFANNKGGLAIDFDDGKIEMYEPDVAHSVNKSIILDADAETNPFTIGQYFSVDWDGSMSASNASFSGSITGSSISGGTITGGEISGGTITGAAITGNTISGGTISGTAISGGTITGGAISGGTISGTAISGGTITGGAISGGTIEGGAISGGSISGSAISGGTITGGEISGGSISGSEIIGATITGGSISVVSTAGTTSFSVSNSGYLQATGAYISSATFYNGTVTGTLSVTGVLNLNSLVIGGKTYTLTVHQSDDCFFVKAASGKKQFVMSGDSLSGTVSGVWDSRISVVTGISYSSEGAVTGVDYDTIYTKYTCKVTDHTANGQSYFLGSTPADLGMAKLIVS